MKQIIYPTRDQIALACDWGNRGPSVLDPRSNPSDKPGKERAANLLLIRDLITRLELPAMYEQMRADVLYRNINRIDERLVAQILLSLRMQGYVYRSGRQWVPVPLTGYQLHLVKLLSAGKDSTQIAEFFGVKQARVGDALRRARLATGLLSVTQLVAYAHRSGWIPTFAEQRKLMSGPLVPEGKPYTVLVKSREGAA